MEQNATLPAPGRRTGRIGCGAAAVLGAALAAYVVQRPLTAGGARRRGGPGPGWQHLWFGTFNGVVFLALAGLPLAALMVWALARARRASHGQAAWRMSLAEIGMVYGTAPWVWMTLLPGGDASDAPRRVSLVPLRDLITILAAGPLTATLQIVGNLLIFAALGFLAPVRFTALASVPRVLALGAGCSTLVEVAQYVLRLDRVSSVDDVLLNTAGAGLAALASRRWWRAPADGRTARPRPAPAAAPEPPVVRS